MPFVDCHAIPPYRLDGSGKSVVRHGRRLQTLVPAVGCLTRASGADLVDAGARDANCLANALHRPPFRPQRDDAPVAAADFRS